MYSAYDVRNSHSSAAVAIRTDGRSWGWTRGELALPIDFDFVGEQLVHVW